ncbi:DUF5691 domain-containing protein [Lewinella sp. W8]|uniref:DUF5691 domain-containing protein n=1 Tax=Lewinella sp. W8 TaxID=2528208 RepID=UPI0010675423|nr:DUF5691 domain-containing protein [Lewinella sp. W8]MTB51605.1 hypothetical protein [Lewinella sp. W8]
MPSNAPDHQWFEELRRVLTLGTQRHSLPDDIAQWVEAQQLVEATADPGERLMAAWAVLERTRRAAGQIPGYAPVPTAPDEELSPPPPTLARGLKLILDGVYPGLIDEAINLLREKNWLFPPLLLPGLLELAAKQSGPNHLPFAHYDRAVQRFLAVGGNRATWLAALHPEWSALLPKKNPASSWSKAAGPRERAHALWHWRKVAPGAAREALAAYWKKQSPKSQEILLMGMQAGLSDQDHPWLREALVPKRRGVRRTLARLLLLSGEADVQNDFRALAAGLLTTNGNWRNLTTDPRVQAILERYGGADKKVPSPLFWLATVPVTDWEALSGRPVGTLLREISAEHLGEVIAQQVDAPTGAGKEALLREVVTRPSPKIISPEATMLADQLDRQAYLKLVHEVLGQVPEALREDRPLRHLLMSSRHRWSDRVSRAVIHEITLPLRSRAMGYEQQKLLAQDWRATATRLDPAIMPWLRSQLDHHTHRPDVFGKLASELLQTTHFRLNVFYRR